jgi:type II secretory pathway component PulF
MANPMEHGEASGRLSDDELVRMTEQIAHLTAAGLPLGPGLWATAEELPLGTLRSTLLSVSRALDAGASVEGALSAQGKRLPGHLRGLVQIGSRTGKISQVLGRFVEFLSVGTELRRRIAISMAYPIIALSVALAVMVFICSTLVGTFAEIYRDFGVPLPRITMALLAFSRLFTVRWEMVGEGLIGILILLLAGRFVLNDAARRSLVSGIPVIGAVWKNTSLTEFCHLLGLLLECEVPLGEALRLTSQGVRDSAIDRACGAMARDIEGGMSLADSIGRCRGFPRGLHQVLRWAEGHQSLPATLHMAGEMFEARARTQASFAGTVLFVIAVIAILFGVATMILGLFLPLITLISRLAG